MFSLLDKYCKLLTLDVWYSSMPFIQIEKSVHFYTVEGPADAPALVFANSLGSDHRIWDPVVPRLKENYRIIRLLLDFLKRINSV